MTAVDELVGLLGELERAGTSMMVLARAGRPDEPWTLYPDEWGIFDRSTRCQVYCHSHVGVMREHGHFHTVRLFDDHSAHVVGISMAPTGWPQALFTVNLWAIGEPHEPSARIKRYARRFRLRSARVDPRVPRFINLMFRIFLPEIQWLQDEKERAIAAYRASHSGREPFEDRSVDVLSRVDLHFGDHPAHVAQLERAHS